MNKIRLTIGRLILFGVLSVIGFFLVGNVIGVINLSRSVDKVKYINNEVDYSLNILNNFREQVVLNKSYVTSWVYVPSNLVDQEALRVLIDTDWVELSADLGELIGELNREDSLVLTQVKCRFDTIILREKAAIINVLIDFKSREDMEKSYDATSYYEDTLISQTDSVLVSLEAIVEQKLAESIELKNDMITGFSDLTSILVAVSVISVIAGLLIAFFINNVIAKPIVKLTEVVDTLGKGEVPETVDYKKNNEIGDILKSVNNLTEGIKSYTSFATSVGEGKLNSEFEKLGENDVLGTSLIDMRDNLQKIAEEERKRAWSTEGLAQFATILRQEEDIIKLSQSIVSSLVKYVKANQAGLFVAYGKGEEECLELKATYAYDREKFDEKTIKKGQGLVGQCWYEGEYIYMTDMPNNYVNIGSGLGDANPNCLLIVPLIYNDLILGVIEIASFNKFTDNEIEFILKLGESIAATISTAKVNESTSNLLSGTNEMTEQLQSQEEELRQQTEELLATQEESERRYQTLQEDFKELKKEKDAIGKAN